MRFRFCSGSVTPASRARKRSCACTWTSGTWKRPPNVSTTCSASSLRSRPWSTKTQVSWSPTALWTSSAATALSTPPESAHSTRSRPTCARMRSTCSSITAAGVHDGRDAGDAVEEVLQHLLAVRRVHDLGVELDAVEAARGVLERGDRRGRRAATTRAPAGGATTESRWDIQTVCSSARSRKSALSPARSRPCRTRRRRCGRRGRRAPAPSAACRNRCRASGRRARRSRDRRAARRRRRPTPARRERISAAGLRRAHLLGRRAVRDELRVDARLAHAARDQLRVLAAEVDDQHRAAPPGAARGSGTTSAAAVIRRVLRDRDVVRVRLAQARRR